MSKADPNMRYGTRSGVSRAGREVKKDADDLAGGLNGFAFYEKKLHEIERPTLVPKTEKTRTPQTSRGPILYFGTTSSVNYEYESDANNEDSEADQKDESVKSDVSVKDQSESDDDDTSANSDFDANADEANEANEAEQTDEDLDEAILAGVDDLLARVNGTMTKEERCWYELEAPHCRNRRLPFILRSELDVLDTIKNREIKEMFETLTEVASHYKDTLAREKALKDENTLLKARLKSNTNILLSNIGYSYASNAESYDDFMADAPSA